MMKMRWFGLSALVAGATLVAGLAVAQPNTPAPQPLPKKEKVKVILAAKFGAFAPMYVADKKGELAKENLEVEYVIAKTADQFLLLSTGQGDVGFTSASAGFFNAVATGADMRIVAPGMIQAAANKQGLYVSKAFLKGRPYAPALLKGATIGSTVGVGSTVTHWIQRELQKGGLTLADVKFRQTGAADILIAVENGALEAGFISDPFWTRANLDKVQFVTGLYGEFSSGAILYGKSFLQPERRAVADAFMRAILRTTRTYMQGDIHKNEDILQLVSKEVGVPADVLRPTVAPTWTANMDIGPEVAVELQKTYRIVPGVLSYDKDLPADKAMDLSFLEKARKG